MKPMLAPNKQLNPKDLPLPLLASMKMDGVRCLIINGELRSRSLKPTPNIQLQRIIKDICEYTKQHNIIIDGEWYSHDIEFGGIVSTTQTLDTPIPDSINFHCFDLIKDNDLTTPFIDRIENYRALPTHNRLIKVNQTMVNYITQTEFLMNEALTNNYEGLILKSPYSQYKPGRCTLNEGLMYKMKPYVTIDAKVINVEQATIVDPSAPKKINELGGSVTSKKKADRILIEQASALTVIFNGLSVSVNLACTNQQAKEIWSNKKSYIGRIIEYKYMEIGMKDLPRHPQFLRFRYDISKILKEASNESYDHE